MRASRKQQGSGRIVGHSRAADNSAGFHAYFSGQYLQRYADLFQALAQPVQHVALLNSFADVNDCDELGMESHYRSGVVSCLRWALLVQHCARVHPERPPGWCILCMQHQTAARSVCSQLLIIV